MANLVPENRMEQILAGENITPVSRSEYFVKEAIDNAGSGGGGSDLPAAGADGNVLTADNGEWVSAAPNNNELIVTGTINTETFAITDLSATFAQVSAAVLADKTVFILAKDAGKTVSMCATLEMFLASTSAEFYGLLYVPGGHKNIVVTYSANGNVETNFIDTLPSVTASNNGEVLGVNNGSVEWVSPSTLSNAPYIIHITQSGTTFSTTETVAEIAAAFEAGKVIQGRYHYDDSAGIEPTVGDINATIESYVNAGNGTEYILTVSWHDDGETTKRLYLDMTASATTDVFTVTVV